MASEKGEAFGESHLPDAIVADQEVEFAADWAHASRWEVGDWRAHSRDANFGSVRSESADAAKEADNNSSRIN